jgi:menaquinone-dependent protoporphyrinogen IX oxidase
MRGLIAYDTYFGNAGQVAAAIADELLAAGHEVRLINLHEEKADARALAAETDFVVVGGPTRMKHISRRARRFATHLDAKYWAGKQALVCDTYCPLLDLVAAE